jgi:hypothetical protein
LSLVAALGHSASEALECSWQAKAMALPYAARRVWPANLHDAELLDVRIDLESGVAEMRIGLVGEGGRIGRLRCARFRRVVVDRDLPWGPSASINHVTGGNERLDVELQSGDHVLLYGEKMSTTFSLEAKAAH